MYERIDQRAAQQAVQTKTAADRQYDMNEKLGAQLGVGSIAVKGPLMDQEYQRLCEAVSGLDSAVSDLLERISPILQPGMLSDAKEANGSPGVPEATPSEMRAKLIKARMWVESISAKIAAVRYTIEI